MPSNHLILYCSLMLFSVFPSITVFSNESVLRIRWPKYWSFSFNISSSYEYSGLISFRIDWFNLLTVQGTLKSLLQHHSVKASILQLSAFFMVQLSHPYMNTGKIIGLIIQAFVGKVMSVFEYMAYVYCSFSSKKQVYKWLKLSQYILELLGSEWCIHFFPSNSYGVHVDNKSCGCIFEIFHLLLPLASLPGRSLECLGNVRSSFTCWLRTTSTLATD